MPRFGEFLSSRTDLTALAGTWVGASMSTTGPFMAPDGTLTAWGLVAFGNPTQSYWRQDTRGALQLGQTYAVRVWAWSADGLPHTFGLWARRLSGGTVWQQNFQVDGTPRICELTFTVETATEVHIIGLGVNGLPIDLTTFRVWRPTVHLVAPDFETFFERDAPTLEHVVFTGGNIRSLFGNTWAKVGSPQATQPGRYGMPSGALPGGTGNYFEASAETSALLADLATGDFVGGVVYQKTDGQDDQLLGNASANTGFSVLLGVSHFAVAFLGSALVNEATATPVGGLNVTTFGRIGTNGYLRTNRLFTRSGGPVTPTASALRFRIGQGAGAGSNVKSGGIFEVWLSRRSPTIAEFTTINEAVLRKLGQ